MLTEFVAANRDLIIAQTRARVAARQSANSSDLDVQNGIPIFLDQLGDALRLAESSAVIDHAALSRSASMHGGDLLRLGLTVAQVVHVYGDVCQTITALAVDQHAPISSDEFRTLNLCLDDAIAEAVTEYARLRERSLAEQGTERLGVLAHELRNLLNTAILSFESIRSGRVAANGSTAAVHGRSLLGLRDLIDRSVAAVRLEAGLEAFETMVVAEFLEEVEIAALLQATSRGVLFSMNAIDRSVTMDGDRQILSAALSNLLHNAFKFTHPHESVSLTTTWTADRVVMSVEDHCGGLPPGKADELFLPYAQRGADRSGLGLGLSIVQKAAIAHGGGLRVEDLPGKGCVFTLDLPRVRTVPSAPAPRRLQ